ncbi:MAG TPA: acyl-CoA dehydrogenase family protein [Reyranella sp.]|nr:acyl-CoA dehydrogenase family protein [Reyranella sp.]
MDRVIELGELRDSARRAFPAGATMSREEGWARIVELGWLLTELPVDAGGLDLGRAAAAAIAEELGRSLASVPLIPALLALRALVAAGGRADWVDRICSGAYVPLNLLPSALEHGPDGELSGTAPGLFDADLADHVVIGAADACVLVPIDAPGVSLVERPLWDPGRRMFELRLEAYRPAAADVLADGCEAARLCDDIARSAHLLVAADALGGAAAALDMTVDYLKVRRQYDRPLALFQALKHRCADLATHRAAAGALLWSRAADPETCAVSELGAVKALACSVYSEIAEEAIQLHGGIGLTVEHPCHLFLKRAMLDAVLCGDADQHYEAAGRALLAD